MTPREIKAELVLVGVTQTDIAKNLKLSKTTINLVISKRGTSKRVQNAIARAIKKPFKRVWGLPA